MPTFDDLRKRMTPEAQQKAWEKERDGYAKVAMVLGFVICWGICGALAALAAAMLVGPLVVGTAEMDDSSRPFDMAVMWMASVWAVGYISFIFGRLAYEIQTGKD